MLCIVYVYKKGRNNGCNHDRYYEIYGNSFLRMCVCLVDKEPDRLS